MKLLIFSLITGLFLGGAHFINGWINLEDDNIVEEFIEDQIDDATGIDIDLTPKSLEAPNYRYISMIYKI